MSLVGEEGTNSPGAHVDVCACESVTEMDSDVCLFFSFLSKTNNGDVKFFVFCFFFVADFLVE